MKKKKKNLDIDKYISNLQKHLNKRNDNYQKIMNTDNKSFKIKKVYNNNNMKSTPNIFNNDIRLDINKKLLLDSENLSNKMIVKNIYLSNSAKNKKLNYNDNNYYLKKNIKGNFDINNFNKKNYFNIYTPIIRNKYYKSKIINDDEDFINTYNSNNSKFVPNETKFLNKNQSSNIIMRDYTNNYDNLNSSKKNNKNSINNDDNDNSNELSEIANNIVNTFPMVNNECFNSQRNEKILNRKIILSKENKISINNIKNKGQNTSPKNYTFKTVLVNNFCVVPMNSSFIDKNRKNKIFMNKRNNHLHSYNNKSISISNSNKNYKNNNHIFEHINTFNNQINHSNNKVKFALINKYPNKQNININNSYFINNNNNNKIDNKNITKNRINNYIKNNKKTKLENNNIFKEKDFNEDYYYTTMDLSKLLYKDNNNNNNETNKSINKKHIQFDLTKNIIFCYNDRDYITKYQRISKNKNIKIKNVRKNNDPIIKKFNKSDIKINNNYISKENLDEKEIFSELIKFFEDNNKI